MAAMHLFVNSSSKQCDSVLIAVHCIQSCIAAAAGCVLVLTKEGNTEERKKWRRGIKSCRILKMVLASTTFERDLR